MIISVTGAQLNEPLVHVNMTVKQAKWLSYQLSDAACWMRGFKAALPSDDLDRSPMGIEGILEFNIALKRAMEKPL